MNVLLLSRYGRLGASSRIRSYQYLPHLESQGIHVTVAPFFEDKYIENLYAGRGRGLDLVLEAYLRRLRAVFQSAKFDLVWVEYETFPWMPACFELLLSILHTPYVVDFDDAVFHRYDLHPNYFVRMFLGRKIDHVMRRAAAVIVGNDYLLARARRAGAKSVVYLPSVVDLKRYAEVKEVNNDVFTIGWIGSPATVRYLQLIQPSLFELCKGGNARLIVAGGANVEIEGVPVVRRPWSEETEVAEIRAFDVGIMPLPDEPWERGKCGYKLIQYMACGRPVVASPVGANLKIVEDGVSGFLAATPSEWVRALTALREDRLLRERMGRAGRRRVETEFSLQVTAPRLVDLLRTVAKELV